MVHGYPLAHILRLRVVGEGGGCQEAGGGDKWQNIAPSKIISEWPSVPTTVANTTNTLRSLPGQFPTRPVV